MSDTDLTQPTNGSHTTTTRPALTLSQAAEAGGMSRSTIRRKLDGKEFPHAYRDGGGPLMVPVTDLIAPGLKPNVATGARTARTDRTVQRPARRGRTP